MSRSEQAVRSDFSLAIRAHSPAAPDVLGFFDGAIVRIAIALAVATVACIPAIVHTTVTPDGTHYCAIASNLLQGHGFKTGLDMPATNWMPLYPILLAALMGLLPGASPANAAVVLNILAVAAIFLLAWGLLRTWRGRVDWLTWSGAALTVLSPGLVRTAELALAETVFTVFVLLLVYAVTRAEVNPKWLRVVVLASVLVALTRHIGVIILVAVAFAWFRWSYVPVLLPGVVSSMLWLCFCGTGGQLSGFSLVRGLSGLFESLTGALDGAGGVILFGILIAAVWSRRRHRNSLDRAALAGILALLLTALAGFVLVMGDMDGRMQLAAQVLLWLALIGAAAEVPAVPQVRYGACIGAAACCLLGILQPTPATTSRVDFNSKRWRESRVMELVRNAPAGLDIYSDAQDGIWYATGRVTYAHIPTGADSAFGSAWAGRITGAPETIRVGPCTLTD